MTVLLIHQAFVSPNDAGGTRHYEFAKRCLREGYRFIIVASNLSYLSGAPVLKSKRFVAAQDLEGICVLRAYTYPSLHRSFAWRVLSFLSFMVSSVWAALRAGPVDIVVGTSPPIFQAISAWIVATVHRRPFLLEVRDLWPDFAVDMGVLKNPLLIGMSRWLERFLYARADHILVNSPAYVPELVAKGVLPSKITLIPNGVDPDQFDPQSRGEAFRQELGLNGKFVLTYAGALGLANDIPTILRSANRLKEQPQIHFLLVGDGMEKANLEAMARKLNLMNVTFTHARSKAQMPEVLAASDACVATLQNIPMFRTTYPNKVFDYMAAGRPTILGIDGAIRQVVDAAGGGIFVPPGDDAALAAAAISLAGSRSKAEAMGQAARDYVVKHYNRHAHAVEFVCLLERLTLRNQA